MHRGGAQAADAERREAAKRKAEAKTKKIEADEKLHLAAKTNNVRCIPVFCCVLISVWRSRSMCAVVPVYAIYRPSWSAWYYNVQARGNPGYVCVA